MARFYLIFAVILWWSPISLALEKNGFDLSNSTIPIDKILSGGPPRDGIPAIDQPKFLNAQNADFLQASDRILGINYKGVQRAYPINILNWHEIVNDTIKGESVVVTYCPLCGTGVVYSGTINGQPQKFGVSGLLYNSDVLLYDRATASLWSQILSTAISGKMVGTTLTTIPVQHTSWAAWRRQYPQTQVLSQATGFKRDYSRTPYQDYDANSDIFFPLNAESRRYHPKERVLGVQIGEKFKAYPFVELAKYGSSPLIDQFAGKTLRIEFDVDNRDGQVFDNNGKVLPSINSFWFAWYAFHPKTAVFEPSKDD